MLALVLAVIRLSTALEPHAQRQGSAAVLGMAGVVAPVLAVAGGIWTVYDMLSIKYLSLSLSLFLSLSPPPPPPPPPPCPFTTTIRHRNRARTHRPCWPWLSSHLTLAQ